MESLSRKSNTKHSWSKLSLQLAIGLCLVLEVLILAIHTQTQASSSQSSAAEKRIPDCPPAVSLSKSLEPNEHVSFSSELEQLAQLWKSTLRTLKVREQSIEQQQAQTQRRQRAQEESASSFWNSFYTMSEQNHPPPSVVTVPSKIYINALTPPSSSQPQTSPQIHPEDDLMLVTHGSVAKLKRMVLQLQQWNGPASIALYLSTPEDIDTFVDFYTTHRVELDQAWIHVLLEHPNDLGYPHNRLRNIALDHATTGFFLAMDVDFITPHNCYERAMELIHSHSRIRRSLRNKTLVVLPAFEWFFDEPDPPLEHLQLPKDRTELIELWDSETVAPFHIKSFFRGHGPTDFDKWKGLNSTASSVMYDIDYGNLYEPYVLGYRHAVPRYWESLRGYGFNKLSWIMECYYSGMRFAVLRDLFVVHLNHNAKDAKPRKATNETKQAFGLYVEYLVDAYGVDFETMRKMIGGKPRFLEHTELWHHHTKLRLQERMQS